MDHAAREELAGVGAQPHLSRDPRRVEIGLDEEDDMFAPAITSARRRAIWLGVNLGTAFLAASVVDLFQTTIDKIVLLAVLMPVVPSMGGVAGSQSLTIITRAIALGQIDRTNAGSIFRKEVLVGVLNGMLWASIVAVFTYFWFNDWHIGVVIAGAANNFGPNGLVGRSVRVGNGVAWVTALLLVILVVSYAAD